jgi:uncharacterized LabA/DUF88 family protein
MPERVIAYIDGYNLYFGLRDANMRRYLWLNLQLLAGHLLKQGQELVFKKYFTSRVSYPKEKQERQALFLEALQTLDNFTIHYGQFQVNPRRCRKCGYKDLVPNEKMTDVNIAVEMLTDAFGNKFDTALLISGDGDLTAPLVAIRANFPDKRIVVAFPPERYSFRLVEKASAYFTIGRANLAKSLFPYELQKPDGYILRCPDTWR